VEAIKLTIVAGLISGVAPVHDDVQEQAMFDPIR
jgi:hypothetical protein